MKKFAIAGFIGFSLVGCATVPTADNPPMTEYQRIVEIPNVKQDLIYEGSRQWVAKSFKSANSVIQYQDKSTGSIIGKGNMPFTCTGWTCANGLPYSLDFTFKVDAKDNKARVSFSDLNIHQSAGYSALLGPVNESNRKVVTEEEKTKVKSVLDTTIDSLADDVKKTATVDKNW